MVFMATAKKSNLGLVLDKKGLLYEKGGGLFRPPSSVDFL
jgi:hypothetical protein